MMEQLKKMKTDEKDAKKSYETMANYYHKIRIKKGEI